MGQLSWVGMQGLVVMAATLVGVWCVHLAIQYVLLLRRVLHQHDGGQDLGAVFFRALVVSCTQMRCAGPASKYPPGRRNLMLWGCAVVYGVLVGAAFGTGAPALVFVAQCTAMAMLLVLAIVDAKTSLLPDALTLPFLWLGLVAAWVGGPVSLHDAVAGVVAGYLFLWLFSALFQLMRRRNGMGRGDFKLLAALGAWVGVGPLPYVLLGACLSGILFACVAQKRLLPVGAYPFGPFLAVAGAGAMVAQPFMLF